jgi:hypothetical protein
MLKQGREKAGKKAYKNIKALNWGRRGTVNQILKGTFEYISGLRGRGTGFGSGGKNYQPEIIALF